MLNKVFIQTDAPARDEARCMPTVLMDLEAVISEGACSFSSGKEEGRQRSLAAGVNLFSAL